MNRAIYSVTINHYDKPRGGILLNSYKISVCSSAETLADVIKEKTNINPPNLDSIYCWVADTGDGNAVYVIFKANTPLHQIKTINDYAKVGVYLFEGKIYNSSY